MVWSLHQARTELGLTILFVVRVFCEAFGFGLHLEIIVRVDIMVVWHDSKVLCIFWTAADDSCILMKPIYYVFW